MSFQADELACATSFLDYINSTPTPFHLVKRTAAELSAAGFERLREGQGWARNELVKPGGKYFFERNNSTIVAFVVGGKFDGLTGGFKVVGAHSDSPVLKIKPTSKRCKLGYVQVGVETYGGGLWHTWFDRDLSVAGRVIVKTGEATFETKIVTIERPLFRVPSLCIHLQTGEERKAFSINKETHLSPILALTQSLNATDADADVDGDAGGGEPLDDRHAPELLRILAEKLGCSASAIVDLELTLFDVQEGSLWGARNEFLSMARLDNQVHCYTGMAALIAHAGNAELLANDCDVSVIACFDHEEVGSRSAQGAMSPVMRELVSRVTGCFVQPADEEMYATVASRSFMISADVAHAVHPNYAHKHEDNHRPVLNKGTVIKTNSSTRYATNAVTGFFCRELFRRAGASYQEFVVRQDCPCGTTIGPIVAAETGIRTVDVGVPSLSMHSIRETCGVKDILNSQLLFESFFANFRELDDSLNVEDLVQCPVATTPR